VHPSASVRVAVAAGVVTALSACSVATGTAPVSAVTTQPPTQAQARHFAGLRTVGALFPPGGYPGLHICTASVVASRSGEVIMTAAHCVYGTGTGYVFVPGYRNGTAPYGAWRVTGAYGDPGWLHGGDPHRDWAFLTVSALTAGGRRRSLQSVVGANRLMRTARARSIVTVVGYALGSDDEALRCTARVYRHAGWPAFHCGGFVDGTSGSPWLRAVRGGYAVTGDIGGLHQGGCSAATSYSPPLGPPAQRALARAGRGGTSDFFPPRPDDGCGTG
jgi:hypothetical protein